MWIGPEPIPCNGNKHSLSGGPFLRSASSGERGPERPLWIHSFAEGWTVSGDGVQLQGWA